MATMTDKDTTLDVDFDKTIPCLFAPECERPATWRETNLCPSRHGADVCAVHRAEELRFHEEHCRTLACASCDHALPHPHVKWRSL